MSTENYGDQHQHGMEALLTMHSNKALLIPLKTTLETKTQDAVLNVYFTTVPVKKASVALNLIRSGIPNNDTLDLQHLRRFAKYTDVPEHVRASMSAAVGSHIEHTPDSKDSNELLLIIGSTKSFFLDDIVRVLSPSLNPVIVCSTPVPLLSPTSQEQANLWTSKYWPTVYKKSNPFGPHPSIVSRTEEEFREDVEKWIELAAEAAEESSRAGHGEAIGVVIVERRDGIARPLVVAGDARWLNWHHGGAGNVTAHATLRAIAMVAGALMETEEAARQGDIMSGDLEIFQNQPTTNAEQCRNGPSASGYLCHKLEIYCTHEPCVMCSMAILHSRFDKVIFQHRMAATGGLCADGDLGHGLFWRKELNWQLLAWQMVSQKGSEVKQLNANINA